MGKKERHIELTQSREREGEREREEARVWGVEGKCGRIWREN